MILERPNSSESQQKLSDWAIICSCCGLRDEIKNESKNLIRPVSANFEISFAWQSTSVPSMSPQISFEIRIGALI